MAAGHDRGRVGVDDPAESQGVERVVETRLAPRPAQPVSGRSLFELAAGRQPLHDYRRHPGISEQLSKPHGQEAAGVSRRAERGLGRALSPVHGLVGEDATADCQDCRDLKVADLENDVGTGREALPAEGFDQCIDHLNVGRERVVVTSSIKHEACAFCFGGHVPHLHDAGQPLPAASRARTRRRALPSHRVLMNPWRTSKEQLVRASAGQPSDD
jgi:hypothetical protein